MDSFLLQNEEDVQSIHTLIAEIPGGTSVPDLDELLQLSAVRAATRLWKQAGKLVAFALVDEYNNLYFDMSPHVSPAQLEDQIVGWGVEWVRKRNLAAGEVNTLDASCSAKDTGRIDFLEKHGFQRDSVRTLRYARSLSQPIPAPVFPEGFGLRCARGEAEVESLVALHRAAFGTDHMTVEYRLAMMHAPQYVPDLDLVVTAPEGDLCAFCVCSFEVANPEVAYTDPIGTHIRYQRLGLGRAVVTAGLRALRDRGAKTAELGTSSENVAMQRLAESLGFTIICESLWF
jgi:ribosomal protein S18 acetylase RimI-like enzyme